MSLIENAGFLHFCRRLRVSCVALAGLFELGTIGPVLAADIVGSADHPLVSRYSGSTIYAYETKAYDAYYGILGPSDGKGGYENGLELEGKITRILYGADRDRSTLEIFRNYKSSLEKAGFDVLFDCATDVCGQSDFGRTGFHEKYKEAWPGTAVRDVFVTDMKNQRFLAAKLTRPEGNVYVFGFIGRHLLMSGMNRPWIQLDVVELEPMETNMVKVDPEALGNDIAQSGHAIVAGIYFDTDASTLKAESADSLRAVADLLRSRPDLNVHVVGHTDSMGGFDYNINLSRARAASIVVNLTEVQGIDPSRLTPNGVGPLAPVASNQSEAGRALNRRVELVEIP